MNTSENLIAYNYLLLGAAEHTYDDLAYYDINDFCLVITDKKVSILTKNERTPKFIPSPKSVFRSFDIFDFSKVNLLSSGMSKYRLKYQKFLPYLNM